MSFALNGTRKTKVPSSCRMTDRKGPRIPSPGSLSPFCLVPFLLDPSLTISHTPLLLSARRHCVLNLSFRLILSER